jgi:hypothetical protein
MAILMIASVLVLMLAVSTGHFPLKSREPERKAGSGIHEHVIPNPPANTVGLKEN